MTNSMTKIENGMLRWKDKLMPMHIPAEDILTVTDVHLGEVAIWMGMRGTLFCDIDGTVADLTHRRSYLEQTPKNYPMFEKTMADDLPIPSIIKAVQRMHDAGWTVVMCTGRSARNWDVTEKWLKDNNVPYEAMYSRSIYEMDAYGNPKLTRKGKPMPDHRKDSIVKKELLDQAQEHGYYPHVVFDDRNQVVEMWRENGIPVVQVAEGDF